MPLTRFPVIPTLNAVRRADVFGGCKPRASEPVRSGRQVVAALASAAIIAVAVVSALSPAAAAIVEPSPGPASLPVVSSAQAAGMQCAPVGTLRVMNETEHVGDLVVPAGQTLVIANWSLHLVGNIIVDGGTLIVRNATLSGYAYPLTNWILQNGGCMEFSNTTDLVLDNLWVGGRSWRDIPDNSRLLVSNSTMAIAVFMTGSNETVRVADTIWWGFLKFTPWGPEVSSRVEISRSQVAMLGLSFDGRLSEGGRISNLRPGFFGYWNLHQNQTVTNVPYDLTLRNVTLVPNTIGPGPWGSSLFGWGIMLGSGSPATWPNLTISDSRIEALEVGWGPWNWYPGRPVTFRGVPSRVPTTLTIFDTVSLVNTTIMGQLQANPTDSDLTIIDGAAVGVFASGTSRVTLVNSTLADGFNPWNCRCTFAFDNAAFGIPRPVDFRTVPFSQTMPLSLRSFWSNATGFGLLTGSTVVMSGNLTFHLGLGPNPPYWVNTVARREYPVAVTDPQGARLAGVVLAARSLEGNEFWRGTTDGNGLAYVPFAFGNANWTRTGSLVARFGGDSCDVGIRFKTDTPVRFVLGNRLIFRETGLAPGTPWSVALDGITKSSTSDTVEFCPASGTHAFEVAPAGGTLWVNQPAYSASPQKGTASINGGSVFVPIRFSFLGNSLRIVSGSGTFASVSPVSKTVYVLPGRRMNGTVLVVANNTSPWGAQSIGTPSWGNHSKSWWQVDSWLSATSVSSLVAAVDVTAPLQGGTFRLLFAFHTDIAWGVASGTDMALGSPVWGDGNDIADFNDTLVRFAQVNGHVRTPWLGTAGLYDAYVAVDALTVEVVDLRVSATANVSAGTLPLSVSFKGSTSGGLAPYLYDWTFGDGGTSTNATPVHVYAGPGTFVATFTATDAHGVEGSVSVTILVRAPPLQLSVAADRTTGIESLLVSFHSQFRGGWGPYGFLWTFGDGGTSTLENPAHLYVAPGNYTSVLVLTDSQGDRASISLRVVVAARLRVASAANVTGLAVRFSSAPEGGVPPYTFLWDFGDGGASAAQNPTHAYPRPGMFRVIVTVSDSSGQVWQATFAIEIQGASTASPAVSPWVVVGGVAVAIAVGVGILGVWLRRRRRTPPDAG
jgi:PKD repeat protein